MTEKQRLENEAETLRTLSWVLLVLAVAIPWAMMILAMVIG